MKTYSAKAILVAVVTLLLNTQFSLLAQADSALIVNYGERSLKEGPIRQTDVHAGMSIRNASSVSLT